MCRRSFPFLLLVLGVSGHLAAQESHWSTKLGGSFFGLATTQSTLRGADGIAGAGWLHGTLERTGSSGHVSLETMLSVEPLFEGKCGYPRLLAGAPVCENDPFMDRSHAHPFIMRLAGTVEGQAGRARVGLMAGLAGDPALGPEIYLHRPSAALDPLAPMLMHEFNPAHAVHGVGTTWLQIDRVKLEISAFNGGSGDSNPYDLDLGPLRSWSVRASWQAGPATRVQLSHGNMQASSEHFAHGAGNARFHADIASVETQQMLGEFMLAATVGIARGKGAGAAMYGGLLELQGERGRHIVFARGEWAKRDEIEGIHIVETDEHFTVVHDFRVAELANGYGFTFLQRAGLSFTTGVRASLSFVPEYLQPRYGHAHATTITGFINVRPAAMHHHH